MSCHPVGGWDGEDRQRAVPLFCLFPAPLLLPKGPGLLEGVQSRNGCSPPQNLEKLGDGPELSLTFFNPTFLGPAGLGMLWAAASPVPSTLPV